MSVWGLFALYSICIRIPQSEALSNGPVSSDWLQRDEGLETRLDASSAKVLLDVRNKRVFKECETCDEMYV